ncbi:Alpha/beta hydrolase family protein [compost metagenome]
MARITVALGVMVTLAACATPVAPIHPPRSDGYPLAALTAVTEVDYRFETHDGQTLVAKLTLPERAERRLPVVIFIGGSGSWDSNYARLNDSKEISFVLPVPELAKQAARSGLAFVRYQKRGVSDPGGQITEQWKTAQLLNLLDDLRLLLAKVKTDPRLDGTRIALVGHSEGTMLASWVGASDASVKAYVLMGLVRRNLKEVFQYQLVTRNGNLLFAWADIKPADSRLDAKEIEAASQKGMAFGNWRTFDHDRDGKLSKSEYLDLLDASYRDWVRKIETSKPEQLVSGNGSPAGWFQQHFRHETVGETWSKLQAPVLVIQGTSDTNTPFKTEAEPFAAMLEARRHPDHRVVGLEGLDHWFKDPKGHSQAGKAFALLVPWLKQRL